MSKPARLALLASDTPRAQEAAEALRTLHDFTELAEAEVAVVLGGDGHMLHAVSYTHLTLPTNREV